MSAYTSSTPRSKSSQSASVQLDSRLAGYSGLLTTGGIQPRAVLVENTQGSEGGMLLGRVMVRIVSIADGN